MTAKPVTGKQMLAVLFLIFIGGVIGQVINSPDDKVQVVHDTRTVEIHDPAPPAPAPITVYSIPQECIDAYNSAETLYKSALVIDDSYEAFLDIISQAREGMAGGFINDLNTAETDLRKTQQGLFGAEQKIASTKLNYDTLISTCQDKVNDNN